LQKQRRSVMFRTLFIAALGASVALCGLSSCATQSRIETSWRVPVYTGKPFSKLALIAVMKNHDESKAFEMAAANEFTRVGAQAVPGFSFLKSDTLLPKAEMEKCVQTTGADGVLIFKLIAINKTRSYVLPTAYVAGEGPYNEWWDDPYWGYYTPYPYHYWGYWYPAFQVIRTPGYWVVDADYQVETALYRTSDNKLVWTAMSGTYDPKGDYDLGNSLSAAVVKTLQKDGLIPVKQGGERRP
jgi:hypothetical protein